MQLALMIDTEPADLRCRHLPLVALVTDRVNARVDFRNELKASHSFGEKEGRQFA